MDEFGAALAAADELVVMEVYPAGEDPIPGAGGAAVAQSAQDHGLTDAEFIGSWSAVAPALVERVRPGDVVMTLGAGDVTLIGPEVLTGLQDREAAGSL
jgi:UDP-N-acetylmuramate--alanine ligase